MTLPTESANSARSVLGWVAALLLVNLPAVALAVTAGPLGAVVLVFSLPANLWLYYRLRSVWRDLDRHRDEGRHHEAHLAALVDAAADAVLMCGEGGVIRDANPAAGRLFGYRREQLIGQTLRLLLPATDLGSMETGQHEIQGAESSLQGSRRDGSTFPVTVALSKVRLEGEARYVVIIHDLSDLLRARREAEAASRAKSAFLLTVSHELRTPLNGILGVADLLSRSPLDEAQHRLVAALTGSGEALLAGVEQVLDYSRLETGQLLLEHHVFSPRAVLDEVERALAAKAAAKGLNFSVRREIAGRLIGDGRRLRQIVEYLADNAIRTTTSGEVEVQASAEGGQLTVLVRDTGPGIGLSDRDPLEGVGLGLSLAARLTRLMGGRIGVQHIPGQGTTFIVRISFRLPGADAPSGRSALVALPDAAERASIESLLRDLGLEPVGVPTGRAALDEVLRGVVSGRPFGLVVLDGAIADMAVEDWVRRVGECSGWSGPVVLLRDGPVSDCPPQVAATFLRAEARARLGELVRARLSAGSPQA
jgi:two-component system, sensor histidine kinase and response regulator